MIENFMYQILNINRTLGDIYKEMDLLKEKGIITSNLNINLGSLEELGLLERFGIIRNYNPKNQITYQATFEGIN